MSAEDRPKGAGAQDPGSLGTPSGAPVETGKPGVIASSGQAEARAYVPPIELPRKRGRQRTVEMDKVRIVGEAAVTAPLDPRKMVTQKMNVPPGGIRPPPPPAHEEVADPNSSGSPWSHGGGGIDRSMLPSAQLGTTGVTAAPKPAARAAEPEEGRGVGIWIGVILVAAALGGGLAFLLRTTGKQESKPSVSSTAPIAVTVAPTAPKPVVTAPPPPPASAAEEIVAPPPEAPPSAAVTASAAPEEPGGSEPVPGEQMGTNVGVAPPVVTQPRKPIVNKPAPSATATAAPTTTSTGPKRLFD